MKVALLAERGVVEFNPRQWNIERVISVSPINVPHFQHRYVTHPTILIQEISDIGFDAMLIPPTRSEEINLHIYGMTCSSCTSTVENELSKMPGIKGVAVALATETAKVVFDHGLVGPREIVERIEELGFDAMLSDQQDATQLRSLTRTKEIQEWRTRFQWSVAFALPVFFISMVVLSCFPFSASTSFVACLLVIYSLPSSPRRHSSGSAKSYIGMRTRLSNTRRQPWTYL